MGLNAPPNVDEQLAALRRGAPGTPQAPQIPNVDQELAQLRQATTSPQEAIPGTAAAPGTAPWNAPPLAPPTASLAGPVGAPPDVATQLARLRSAQAFTTAPSEAPVIAQIGQAARAVGGTLQPSARPPGYGPSPDISAALANIGNLPGIAQIGAAARGVGGAIGAGARAIASVPGIVSRATSAQVENILTGGVGYDQRFAEQGADPTGAKVLGSLFRGTLDPTNLLVAPAPIAKALGTVAAVGKTTYGLAKSAGLVEPIAQAAGATSRLLTEGRITGPAITQIVSLANAGLGKVGPLFNKYYGLPPEVRQSIEQTLGDYRIMQGKNLKLQLSMLDAVPVEADRVFLGKVLTGQVPESQIPDRLKAAYQTLFLAPREATTADALASGVLEEARDNYMRRFYPPDVYAKIKAGATGPLPVSAEEAANMPPPAGPTATTTVLRVPPPEVRAEQILENLPEEGRRSALGRQVSPTQGIRGLTSGFQKRRVLNEEAAMALQYIQDPAVALPAHDIEVQWQIANKNLYQRMIDRLGPDWVRPYDTTVPRDWVGMSQLAKPGPADKYGWSKLMVHPQVAQAIQDMTGGDQFSRLSGLLYYPSAANNALKRVIFLTPTVHSANQARGAYLERGWTILHPAYWDEIRAGLQDAREMGPWEQRRLAAGGSIGAGGVSGQIGQTLDEVFKYGPARGPMRPGFFGRIAGSQEFAKAPGPEFVPKPLKQGAAFMRALNDEVLWGLDAGGRQASFRWAVRQMLQDHPDLPAEMVDRFAARYADRVWNDYSTVHYGPVEKMLNSLLFVYPWTRGRAQLFGAMARVYLPSSAPDVALYRQLAGRWAMANLVLPHIYRAWHDKQSAGFQAARIPAGEYQDNNGRTRQIYINPTGWYNNAAEFAQDEYAFTAARTNPALRSLLDLYAIGKEAKRQGKNGTQEIIKAMVPGSPGAILANLYPAGTPQAFTSQPVPWWMRIAPAAGVNITGPPPSENPRMQMQGLLEQGDFYGAGVLAKQSGLSFANVFATIPVAGRKQFSRGYAQAGKGLPGMPKPPALPKLP